MAKTRNASNAETRDCITTALVRLTETKPLSSITVTELCAAAGVSRMAFYRNYSSKEEVLGSRLAELIAEYRARTRPLLLAGERWYGTGHLSLCFMFFKENSDLMESLFRCGFTWLLVNSVADFLIDIWGGGSREADYILTAFAGSLCACYAPWADGGFKETPREMAELVGKFYVSLPGANKGDHFVTGR